MEVLASFLLTGCVADKAMWQVFSKILSEKCRIMPDARQFGNADGSFMRNFPTFVNTHT